MSEDKGQRTGIAIRYIEAGDGDHRHGTTNGYCNLKCRCTDCRRAWASYCADLRRFRISHRPLASDDPRHGKATTYVNWGCKCAPCSLAFMNSKRDRRGAA